MRVLIVNTLYYPYKKGGAELSVQSLAEKFVNKGIEVGLITLDRKDSYKIENGIQIWRLKIRNTYWPFTNQSISSTQKLNWHRIDANNKNYDSIFTEIYNKFKPNLLFTNNLSGFSTRIWKISKKLGIPSVHTLRDYYLQCPSTTKYKNGENCLKTCTVCNLFSKFKKSHSHLVDYVIGISEFILNDHITNGYFKRANREVIYNGFEINVSQTDKNELKDNEFILGFIGQITKEKGIELLLESLTKIKTITKWKLLVAGHIDLEKKEELNKINGSNNITYLGYSDRKDFYNAIDLLVVPSLWREPFGRVVIEALTNKTAVLGSKRGGITELLHNNKAFIFEPTSKDLISKLEVFMNNKTKVNDFVFDPKHILDFDIDKVSEKYIEVFNKALSS